nr:MAG TPA: hypothetical protein [Caudoviricetes sp.]DAL17132.1 MAG TPA_asm: hypothetical protein [Caudoviricetes sp.]
MRIELIEEGDEWLRRTPPDQIPYAARLDCVRRPIRLRSGNDDFS